MPSAFQKAAEELYNLSFFHAALFMFGLALTMAPQKSLKPSGPCGEKLFIHYELVVRLSFFFVFATFCTAAITSHVKSRVPDGGLQGVSTRTRLLLRVNAALGCVLSAAASVLAVASYTYLLQAKTGLFQCLPAEVRTGVYVTYVVVTYVVVTVYYHTGRRIVLAD